MAVPDVRENLSALPIVQRLWGEDPPPILYHYTSRRGLEGIIAERAVWASEARYLNDARELTRTVVEQAERAISQYGPGSLDAAVRIFGSLFLLTAPMIKDGAFREEREWRLVLPSFSMWDPKVKFRDGGRLLVPYWTVPL